MISSPFDFQRIIKHAEIDVRLRKKNLRTIIKVLKVHGKNIKHLTIRSKGDPQKIDALDFMELLGYVNLKSLTVAFENVQIINWSSTKCLLGKEGSLIFNLALRNESDVGNDFIRIFTPNSVKEIMINGRWNQFSEFLLLQKSIHTMDISYDNLLEPKLFKELKLKQFGLFYKRAHLNVEQVNESIHQLVQDHPQMERVNFYNFQHFYAFPEKDLRDGFEMLPYLLYSMRKMPNLVMLQLEVNQRITPHLNELSHLPKSIFLSLDVSRTSEQDLIILSTTSLPNLEKLQITNNTNFFLRNDDDDDDEEQNENMNRSFTKEFMEKIGRSWPNIRELNLNGSLTSFNIVFENLGNLEKFETFHSYEDIPFYHNSSIYPKMISFKTLLVNSNTCFSNILCSMPNLKVLYLDTYSSIEYTPWLLQKLSEMRSLEELYVGFTIHSTAAVASEKEILQLDKLCCSLKEFSIAFHMMSQGTWKFMQLYDELDECHNLNIYDEEHKLLIQKNPQYDIY